MALQFRRGLTEDLPDPSDAAIGEPLFTTDEGKLRIKKADGSFAVIGSGTSSSNLDLSGIAADSLVKVNASQDGFVAAAGGDLPSHTHPPSEIEQASATNGQVLAWNGSAWSPTTVSETAGAAWGQITGTLSAQDDLQTALNDKADLADFPQNADGSLDLAKESTLTDFIGEFPVDGSGNLDIAQESTLQALAGRTISAGTGLTGGGDLTADRTLEVNFGTTSNTVAAGNHTHAAETLTTASTQTGYLKWTWSSTSGTWSVSEAVASAPSFIDGGDANADDPGN